MKRLVVLTGAGVSAESGFATFRDAGGLWEQYDVNDVASIEGWYRNRQLVLQFYNERRAQLKDAKPNAAHLAIAGLEKSYHVDVIGQRLADGHLALVHLHGELTKVRPENGVYDSTGSEKEVIDVGYSPVILGDKAPNGSQLRPHIVFFGEAVPKIETAIDLVSKADILLIVGSSLQVYPAAGLYRYAPHGCPIYVIDPKPVPISDPRVTFIQDVATKGMEQFVKML